MSRQHQQLADGGWQKLFLVEQLANIGSEVQRAITWQKKGNQIYAEMAFFRSLELFDLTLADKKNISRLKEVCRAREFFVDFFLGENIYGSTAEQWQKFFLAFNVVARS